MFSLCNSQRSIGDDTAGMTKKPERPKPISCNVYKIARKAIWMGEAEAPDEATAIEKADDEPRQSAPEPRPYSSERVKGKQGELFRWQLG
jgi:hypothetical protein